MAADNRLQASAHQQGRFKVHGDATVAVVGRVMHFRATGPWNEEFVDALWRVMLKVACHLPPDGRFVDLVEVQGSVMMTPQALTRLALCVDTAVAQGFRSKATALLMAPGVEGRALMLPKLQRVYGRYRPVSVHADEGEALACLRRCLPDLEGEGLRPQPPAAPKAV